MNDLPEQDVKECGTGLKPVQQTPDESLVGRIADEFTERLNRGENPDVEEYAQRYPELADVLRQALPALQAIRPLSSGLAPAGEPAGDFSTPRELGDFRIIREVGRGGMGIVYEAEQISLDRRVALKVLPFAATMDPRQMQRFQNEARAAASLQHPHIVPVHAVGCERGVHYYAMQFIDGQSLACLIEQQRTGVSNPATVQPTTGSKACPANATVPAAAATTERTPHDAVYFRRVAEWGIQAAEALEHAHSLGIVHRDIKPANLMIDSRGVLWVADFGLARTAADAGLTMTGDVLGTLRYMSPEQALAKHGLVDHRTDVYSLGVTLYELLTATPAVGGKDREQILNAITLEEPRPPRARVAAIPHDLETIVLKGMAKIPSERYSTAREMAEDLRRVLADQPISARRPSLLQRLRKWARRYGTAVRTALVCLLFAVMLLSVGVGWIIRDRALREGEAERQAQAALRDATALLHEDKWAEALEATRRAEALLTAAPDSQLRHEVRELLADLEMAGQLEAVRLKTTESQSGWRVHLNEVETAYMKVFAAYGLDDERLDPHEVAARIRARPIWLQVVTALDGWVDARRQVPASGHAGNGPDNPSPDTKRLIAVARAVDPDPWRDRLRDALALKESTTRRQALLELASTAPVEAMTPDSSVLLARAAANSVDTHSSLDCQERIMPALALLRRARRQHPGDFWVNYELAGQLGVHFPGPHDEDQALRNLEDALRYATAAVSLRPQSFGPHLTLGRLLLARGQYAEAVAEMQEAVRLERPNPEHRPSSRWLRRAERLAAIGNRLPGLLKGEAQPANAEEYSALAFLNQTRTDCLASAARCYAKAFAAQPAMADDLSCADRYNAACTAVLAGCGQGRDAVISDSERTAFRHQALKWLRADLAAWVIRLAQEPRQWYDVKQMMEYWLADSEFDGVRDVNALAKLPEAERQEWQRLWEDVETLRQRAAEPTKKAGS
jgi:serine/threonine protein kinase